MSDAAALMGATDGAAFVPRWVAVPGQFAPWGEPLSAGEPSSAHAPAHAHAHAQTHGPPSTQDAAWAAGYAAGRDEAAAETDGLTDQMAALTRALDRLSPMPPAELAEHLDGAVRALLAQLIGTAGVDEALLAKRCIMLAATANSAGAATIHAHPDDILLLSHAACTVPLAADEGLTRGELRLVDGEAEALAGPLTMLNAWAESCGNPAC